MGPAEAIRDLVEPSLLAAGLELWDVEVGADVVRILVDRPGGVDLDALSTASASLSPLFDEHPDVVPLSSYQLEVSSPGVERTLRTPAHYRAYLGRTVSVKTAQPVAGSRRLRGVLTAVDDDGITLDLDDAPAAGAPVTMPHGVVQRARTVLVWGGPAKATASADAQPGARTKGRRASQSTNPTSGKDATR